MYPSPAGPKNEPGRDDDPVLEQPPGERLRRAADVDPEVERRGRAREPQAARFERGQQRVALARVERAHLLDVRVVRPRSHRRALHELLRRGADVWPEASSAATISGGAQTKPERYPVIDERFESVLKTTTFVRSATCSADTGGSSNQSSEYASSEQTRKPCSRARAASSS